MGCAQVANEDAVTGRRGAARARVTLPARFETLNGTASAIIHNISVTGALIEAAVPPPIGADGILTFGGLECFGTVQWVRSRWCGFAFDDRLSQSTVISLRSTYDSGEIAAGLKAQINDAAQRWAQGRQS